MKIEYIKKMYSMEYNRNLKKCRIKPKLYKTYKLTNNENDLIKYKLFTNSLTTLIRKTKRTYYSDKLHNCSDSKNTWDILNNVMNKKKPNPLTDTFKSCGIEITDPSKISNTFNIFFRDICIELDDNISKDNVDDYKYFLKSLNINSFYITPCNENELLKSILNFKSKTYIDNFGISMKLLKCIDINIITPLSYLINLSLETGIVPAILNISRIIPLFKKCDTQLFTNYRPISLTSQFSKMLEKVFYVRFY